MGDFTLINWLYLVSLSSAVVWLMLATLLRVQRPKNRFTRWSVIGLFVAAELLGALFAFLRGSAGVTVVMLLGLAAGPSLAVVGLAFVLRRLRETSGRTESPCG